MKLKLALFAIGMSALTALAFEASLAGRGLAEPDRTAPSIREGSLRDPLGRGHRGTRYFIGGGPHRGK